MHSPRRRPALTALALALTAAAAFGFASDATAAAPSATAPTATAPTATAPATATAATTAALPADSIYQLPVALTDHRGNSYRMADQRGRPMLVSLFYSSCQFVCPMLIDGIRDAERKLSDAERQQLGVLMVSIDPGHDTVEVLARKADERQLGPRWAMARTDAQTVRKLAAALDVQYRALPNGEFNHTTAMILLDGDGRIVARSPGVGGADARFMRKLHETLRGAPH